LSAVKLAIRFSTGGLLRFLSHQETATAIERLIRRSSIPVSFTQGFHPRMKISYSPAVPTGVGSLANYVLLDCDDRVDGVLELLKAHSVFTLRALGAWYLPVDIKIDDFLDSYRFSLSLPAERFEPSRFDPQLTVVKKTKNGQRSFRAGEVFQNLTVTTLKTCHMVEYFQPTERPVPSEELLKIVSREGTASNEGVFVYVKEGYFKNRATTNILDEIGGI